MYPQWRSKLVAFVLLIMGFCSGLSTSAFAEPTVETLTAPEVEPKGAYAHGDGSVTITNNCSNHEEKNAAVTISSAGEVLSTIPRAEGEWITQACINSIVPGLDNTTYVVQRGSVEYHAYRVVAFRNSAKLWVTSFVDPAGCGSRLGIIQSMAMGQDGNLYAAIYWNYKSVSCPEKDGLVSINPSTGAIRFTKVLTNTGSSTRGTNLSEVQPYENGVVTLNGNQVFYFNYKGEEESSKTFTAASGEATIIEFKIAPDTGRIYWYTQVYKPEIKEYEKTLYYRNLGGSSNEKITLPKGQWLVSIFPTPSNGVVAEWKENEKSSVRSFDYINAENTVVYEKNLSTESGAIVQGDAGFTSGTVVDDFGNVIVRRTLDQTSGDKDRNVVVDSFSPAGIKTRLFNSSSLGKEGVVDSFTTVSQLTQSMGRGHIYLALCHKEKEITEGCDSTKNPKVISISDTSIGEYDYPRSKIFSEGLEKSSYVALGDSYSSGEGVPSFIPPSDTDGCHRSYDAYPVYLANELSPSLRLDAFVACSGAETVDVEGGMKEELPQVRSLNSNTNVITITIGGNNIGFGEFAKECVIGTCNSSSPAYEYSMEHIEVYLPEELEKLYNLIHKDAENAKVYVVGYPQIVPEPGGECTYFINSEKEASREVVVALDKAIEEAAKTAGESFVYINPLTEESPFFGHEICTTESYFSSFEIFDWGYSFHPNKRGQQAYAELINAVL